MNQQHEPLLMLRRARVRYAHSAGFRVLVDMLVEGQREGVHSTNDVIEGAVLAAEMYAELRLGEESRLDGTAEPRVNAEAQAREVQARQRAEG